MHTKQLTSEKVFNVKMVKTWLTTCTKQP